MSSLFQTQTAPRAPVLAFLLCVAFASDVLGAGFSNPLVLYDFQETRGATIRDRSGNAPPVDLVISDPNRIRWQAGNSHGAPSAGNTGESPIVKGLRVVGETKIQSQQPATSLVKRLQRASEITVEAWVAPARKDQSGPARIISLSENASSRNWTLGQDGAKFDFRLRTTRTSGNGIPSTSTPPLLEPRLTHVVVCRSKDGTMRWHINGKKVRQQKVAGDFSNWKPMRLVLANEVSGQRPWLGFYRFVAIYPQAATDAEIARRFSAGPGQQKPAKVDPPAFFEQQVASVLGRRCVECHNITQADGGLDLSRHAGLVAGGENGVAITAGKPDKSLLWKRVAANEMPHDRPPLSEQEKHVLRKWIELGAVWSGDALDPSDYRHQSDGKNWIQRLTVEEYIATVKAAVGVDIDTEARKQLPPDLRADGFRNTAYNLTVDLGHVQAYAALAEQIVKKMDVAAFAKRFGARGRLDADRIRATIEKMGKWLLRGPLSEAEIGAFAQIAVAVAENGGSYNEAMSLIIEAMLQSPRFLYRIEQQPEAGASWTPTASELACRISFMIWGAPPDEKLYTLAENGGLYDPQTLQQEVERMLQDPRAQQRALHFAEQWLQLAGLQNLRPNRSEFPEWKPELADDMRRETLAYFDEIVWKRKRPLQELFNAQVMYVTPRLARHYNLPKKVADALNQNSNAKLQRLDVSETPSRGGLLTQGSLLTVGGDDASMVARGLLILQDVLRGSVSDPPPCVDTTPVPTKAGLTQRGIAESRVANASCGSCHVKFEPLAFGLEKYDGLGAFREQDEHGNRLREDGLLTVPGAPKPQPYRTASELMDFLAKSPRVQQCVTWKVCQFALGRPLVAEDVPALRRIVEQSRTAGGRYHDVMHALIQSDLVQSTRITPKR